MKGYGKVLIVVNDSNDVLVQGLKIAQDEKCWVTVLKVLPLNEGDFNLVGIKNIDTVLDNEASKAIDDINNMAKDERALVKTRIEEGDVYSKIVEVAEEEHCDLIIMGAQKAKEGFTRLLGRSIVDRVMKGAPCPVLVVRP